MTFRYALSIFLVLILLGCGYKPVSTYARNALGGSVYAEVSMSRHDPQNSVLLKDGVNEAIITRLGSKLAPQEEAKSSLKVSIGSLAFAPTVYDRYGYVVAYKTQLVLDILYTKEGEKPKQFKTLGEYDFSVASNSIISDTKRFEAIRYAAVDALDAFISQIAIQGAYRGNHHQ